MLGLSDIVIFPGMVAPLLVESASSTRLIDDVVAGDRFVALVLQRNAESENPRPEELHTVGCAARVLKMLKFPDNTVRVLVEGLRRCQTSEYTSQEPYLVDRVEYPKELTEETLEVAALARNAHHGFIEVMNLSPALSDQVKVSALSIEQPGKLADLIAANLNLNLQERQELLEYRNV